MLDYRLHYAVMATEDRLRPTRHGAITPHRGIRRVFKLGSAKPSIRTGRR